MGENENQSKLNNEMLSSAEEADGKKIIDSSKIKAAIDEIADVLNKYELNLAEAAECARLIMLWAGFEINANAEKIKSDK